MAKEKAETLEGKDEREKQSRNRQINYFIMRYMWQVIRGRGSNTIYEEFQTSRERFTRVIDTGKIRYGKGELERLNQLTGLQKELFTGELRFECPYQTKQDRKTVEEEITLEEWENLFAWRDAEKLRRKNSSPPEDRGAATRKEQAKVPTEQDKICKKLKTVNRRSSNWHFYRLCYFIQERKAAPLRQDDDTLMRIKTALNKLTLELLVRSQIGSLKGMRDLLKNKRELVSAMVVIKEAESLEKEKN